jgi:hypothetical protein
MFQIIWEMCNYDKPPDEVITTESVWGPLPQVPQFEWVVIATDAFPTATFDAEEPVLVTTSLPLETYMKDVLASYKNTEEIHHQFILDVERSSLVLNGHGVDKTQVRTALGYLDCKFGWLRAPRILVLCTQAMCAGVFEWIHHALPAHLYLAEARATNKKRAHIEIKGDSVTYWKRLRIFHLMEGRDNTNIEICLRIHVEDVYDPEGEVEVRVILAPRGSDPARRDEC